MSKSLLTVIIISLAGLAACTSSPFKHPTDLRFQEKKPANTQTLTVKRDGILCAEDTEEKQDCPIELYIDNFKSGTFYINNSAHYYLKPETYNFKVKNCTTDECKSCDVDLNPQKLANNHFTLTVDESGHPFILNGDTPLVCAEEAQKSQNVPASTSSVETTTVIDLAADTLFKFDGSSLNDLLPKGRQEIIDLAQKITSGYATVREIKLVGHTDRLGNDQYNQKLGQSRADTVRDLLVQNGVAANVVSTASAGEQQPVTDGCFAVTEREALKACLQPDRRVSVEITGISK
ncbi:MAG TPA: OmpA family protein [Acinetobacter lwoffii]|uniref:OmpA family protein n=1 Tax=Acinetobacter lwoffii TaxID=28090 RepID=A0A9D2UQT6_ACILW|nr:OmpA family protein [Acinetobacter lwoffii]